jgi:hypothetical protein
MRLQLDLWGFFVKNEKALVKKTSLPEFFVVVNGMMKLNFVKSAGKIRGQRIIVCLTGIFKILN